MTQTHQMPPWKPAPGCGDFVGARALAQNDIDTIAHWVDGGTPEGKTSDMPAARTFDGGWPAGAPDVVLSVPKAFTPPADADEYRCFSVYPHMHLLGTKMKVEANLANGTTACMIDVPQYDFNWQGQYVYKTPLHLARGGVIHIEAHFDNSTGNWHNPQLPTEGRALGRSDHRRDVSGHDRVYDLERPVSCGLTQTAHDVASREAMKPCGTPRSGEIYVAQGVSLGNEGRCQDSSCGAATSPLTHAGD